MKRKSIAFLASSLLTPALLVAACSGSNMTSAEAQVTSRDASPNAPPMRALVTNAQATYDAPDGAWRALDPENTLYIDTKYGRMVVELYPEISPGHVERIKTLTRQKFYDHITFHRVIDGFMNQTGDPTGTGMGDSDLPDLKAEFTFRRDPNMPVTVIGAAALDPSNPNSGEIGVGFYKALPVATQPAGQAIMTKDGKVKAFGLHCKGVTSMARAQDPDSANSQFFLMRSKSPQLDAQYTVWGETVWGRNVLTQITEGTHGQTPGFVPDKMDKLYIAADLPEKDRVPLQVLDTASPAFKSYLKTLKKADGTYPEICDIEVPARLTTANK